MIIEQNKVVSLSYTLEVEGDVIETVTAEKPMQFIFGTGYLLPKFEENISGKVVSDTFDFVLSAKEGYGEVMPDAIVELPKNIFEVDGKIQEDVLKVGNVLPMMDSEGNRLNGAIDKVSKDTVTMNFNHPLAGAALHFSGKVEAIREATEEELTNGLFGEKAHQCGGGCCGSCGSCGSDSEGCGCSDNGCGCN